MIRRRTVILFLAAVTGSLICGTIALVNTRAFRVRYHGWQMERAGQQRYSKPLPPTGNGFVVYECGEAFERYEYHRQKLVELGDIAERHYSFKHLQVPARESKHFSKLLLSRDCPSHIDFSSPYPRQPEPMQLTVWCRPADAEAWDNFVVDHDVSDYSDRFMSAEKGDQ